MKVKDRFWIWGQDPGSHHGVGQGKINTYKLPGINRMDSASGGKYFGIPNCCRVAMVAGPVPPFDAESEKLKDFKQVVWSAVGAGGVTRNSDDQSDIDEVLRQAKKYPNVIGAVLDDFFASVQGFVKDGKIARHSVGSIRSMRDKLHGFSKRRLDLWMVWYAAQLDLDVAEYLELCDVITLWTWSGSELAALDDNIRKFVAKTPGKRRLAGCYMWNYGERKPLTMEQMQFQLDRYYHWIKKGSLEGIVFCSNCIADIGLEAAELTRQWIAKVGNEKI